MADPVSPGGISSDFSDTDSLNIKCESDDDDSALPSTSQVPESRDLLDMVSKMFNLMSKWQVIHSLFSLYLVR